ALFADAYPLLVTTLQTQHTLQSALQDHSLDANLQRFRANIVLDGLEAHEEDHVSRLALEGPISIQLAKPCVRCAVPNVDPQTARVDSRISQTLSTYRQDARMDGAITFGMNAYVQSGLGLFIQEGQSFGAYLAI
ncbi:MOSC domain-containing protein, partial [Arthrospira platensis SPKY1]|nr:MOSC domain-containing protein [Arthrospira platensis SPKY1]